MLYNVVVSKLCIMFFVLKYETTLLITLTSYIYFQTFSTMHFQLPVSPLGGVFTVMESLTDGHDRKILFFFVRQIDSDDESSVNPSMMLESSDVKLAKSSKTISLSTYVSMN